MKASTYLDRAEQIMVKYANEHPEIFHNDRSEITIDDFEFLGAEKTERNYIFNFSYVHESDNTIHMNDQVTVRITGMLDEPCAFNLFTQKAPVIFNTKFEDYIITDNA